MTKEERAEMEALAKERDGLAAANAELNEKLQEAAAVNSQLAEANANLIAEAQSAKQAMEKLLAARKTEESVTVAGFRLESDDPFAQGTMVDYLRISGEKRKAALPFVMPWGSPATLAALKTYRVRVSATGDPERTKAADEAIKKFVVKK